MSVTIDSKISHSELYVNKIHVEVHPPRKRILIDQEMANRIISIDSISYSGPTEKIIDLPQTGALKCVHLRAQYRTKIPNLNKRYSFDPDSVEEREILQIITLTLEDAFNHMENFFKNYSKTNKDLIPIKDYIDGK